MQLNLATINGKSPVELNTLFGTSGSAAEIIEQKGYVENNQKVFDGVQKALDYLMEPKQGVSLEVETTREYLSKILR